MQLFILRHGMTAESDADEDRRLSEKGVQEVEKVLHLRAGKLAGVQKMTGSPLLRVKQTLRIAARVLGYHGPIEESQYLTNGSRLNEIVNFVQSLDFDSGDILVSSHQSCTSILVLWLTGEDILIPNGSLLAIKVSEPAQGKGEILWQISHNGDQVKHTSDFVDQF